MPTVSPPVQETGGMGGRSAPNDRGEARKRADETKDWRVSAPSGPPQPLEPGAKTCHHSAMTYRIAITGAGMGGLAAAALLAKHGHAVSLFERFDTPRPLGSGLVVQPVGLAVLDALGAGAAARSLGAPLTRMLGHSGSRIALDVFYRPDQPGLAMAMPAPVG